MLRREDDRSTPRTLRARRTDPDAKCFAPRFYERDPLFWPIAQAASAFRDEPDWPAVETYVRAFGETPPPITFEVQIPKKTRRKRREARGDNDTVDVQALYDGKITLTKRVPTRPRQWHDFLNALVWAAFPAAKAALHARQYAAISARIPTEATRLPNARTRELDALALIDEGGVIAPHGGRPFIFGHALYEGLVLEGRAMIARALVLPPSDAPLDEAIAAALRDPSLVPEMLPRMPLSELS
ncbi:DUF3025 domain-containing protein [Pendulispora brunnea]|uniref:DUF3025 domain-containing protein n=1 Tax=Pendulispora brunnea TaxID=2905690 RepID=A0ABZ2KNH1_9BACT